jgi:hypothetical protein
VLAVGAILMALGPILQRLPAPDGLPWYAWAGGLILVGTGLVMCTPRIWASAMVSVAGLLFLAHAAALIAALLGLAVAAWAYQMLAIPKLVVVGALAITERQQHGRHRQVWLLVASGLGVAKIAARLAFPGAAWHDAADVLVNLVVAAALWIFAQGLRRREDEWARRRLAEISASFEDFDRGPVTTSN